jgi:hypothetical protein
VSTKKAKKINLILHGMPLNLDIWQKKEKLKIYPQKSIVQKLQKAGAFFAILPN